MGVAETPNAWGGPIVRYTATVLPSIPSALLLPVFQSWAFVSRCVESGVWRRWEADPALCGNIFCHSGRRVSGQLEYGGFNWFVCLLVAALREIAFAIQPSMSVVVTSGSAGFGVGFHGQGWV